MSEEIAQKVVLAEKPLVTFALIAYNQEHYVSEAIVAAFAQTYTPLEIVLSDDCSSDSTFEIMQRAVAEYKGPHRIVLNRNPSNLNIGGHVNAVAALVTGELIVLAAGDDVSMPHRTARLVERWISLGERTVVLCSDFEAMDMASRPVDLLGESLYRGEYRIQHMARGDLRVLGATSAVTKDVFTSFPPMDSSVRHEDRVLPFRALLLGGQIVLINEKLIRYRVDGGVSRNRPKSARDFLYQYMPTALARTLPDAYQRLADLTEHTPHDEFLKRECLATISDHRARIEFAGLNGRSLEASLVRWLWRGARPLSLLKHYAKFRFLSVFNFYFQRRHASSQY